MNTKGKKIWSYDDIYDDIYEYYEYISIFKTKDEGIVAVGQNYNQPKDGLPPSGRCGIITRIDKNGSLLWRRKVWDVNVPFNHCGFNSGTELEDGSLLITGWWRDTLPDPYYDTNVWLIKLDSNGCYNPGCVGNDSVTTTQNIIVIGREMIKLSPNPANDYLKVSWNKTPTPAKSLVVYDLSGKAILQSLISDKSGSTELSISELPSGLYVLKIFGDKWESAPEKFVKE
ncbi:MAG: T9SS type A sorting domain-containing protein [Saprospiraceae bacterium]|nr:T9SS type A sorting domain-containing protein [Saprospiraceae bacterium]